MVFLQVLLSKTVRQATVELAYCLIVLFFSIINPKCHIDFIVYQIFNLQRDSRDNSNSHGKNIELMSLNILFM